ncbi:hypothetical protein C8R45DRAFT_922672 [Mycena sanguinolenta]|nr:hypothetical protein C8R45DRAFT_922672 [Mycena sanguinolenta]
MRYLGGGVGHYQVEVPHNADAEDEDASAPAPDSDEDEFPRSVLLPQAIPPPDAAPAPLPNDQDEDILDPGRPSSSLSQNSDDSEAAQSPAVSESDTDSDLDGNLDDDEGAYSDGEDDLGPEDGDGAIEDEIEDGYTPLISGSPSFGDARKQTIRQKNVTKTDQQTPKAPHGRRWERSSKEIESQELAFRKLSEAYSLLG